MAAPFTAGDLVVVRVGDGSALASSATAVFLDEYTVGGVFVQTVAMPTAASGANLALTMSGTATSEGFLQLSANGQYLTLAGYNAAPGTTSITGSSAATINRVAGLVSLSGTIDTSTAINTGSPGNARSLTSVDGTQFWMGTSALGVNYVTHGTVGSGTQLSTTPSNTRVVRTIGGQLYTSASSGAFQGIATVGLGLPTTSGQTTTLLPGFPTTSGPSAYDYFISGNDAWVADDRGTSSGGGIQHWTLSGGTWTLSYTLTFGSTGFRGLAVDLSGEDPVLYATSAAANANSVIKFIDSGAGSAGTSLFTDPVGTSVFRGIVVIPEPSSAALLGGFGILAWVMARRRR